MNATARYRYIARVTVELRSPLLIGSGATTAFTDNAVVVDARDLPALPATSLAGVLRAAWRSLHDVEAEERLFGYQKGDEGARSRVSLSWGEIHDAKDGPVGPDTNVDRDPVLLDARTLLFRDHVRIDHRGTVDGRGKFDRSAVRAGHRFSFEIELESDEADPTTLEALVLALHDPAVRLGGGTRSGLGAFRVDRYALWDFDLREAADLEAYAAFPSALYKRPKDMKEKRPPPTSSGAARVVLDLEPEEPWLVGGGDPDEWEAPHGRSPDDTPDMLPYRERRVVWSGGRGELSRPGLCVPATAVKGALRHRTAFHVRAKLGIWAGDPKTASVSESTHDLDPWGPQQLEEIRSLFGDLHATKAQGRGDRVEEGTGCPGRVFISDARPTGTERRTSTHVSIDRFTGAPLDGHLFEDEALEGGRLEVELVVAPPETEGEVEERAAWAFERALEDLCHGRLQLGAGYGKGYGWFRGTRKEGGR